MNQPTGSPFPQPWLRVIAGAAAAECCAAVAPFIFADGIASWQLAARWTGRVSLLYFLILYVHVPPSGYNERTFRPAALTFSILHGIHLYLLIQYNLLKGGFPVTFKLTGGITAYLITAFLPFLPSIIPPKRHNWITYGLHFVLLIFGLTYVARMFIDRIPGYTLFEGVAGLTLVLLAIVLRIKGPKSTPTGNSDRFSK